jgi:hypothetical protein
VVAGRQLFAQWADFTGGLDEYAAGWIAPHDLNRKTFRVAKTGKVSPKAKAVDRWLRY